MKNIVEIKNVKNVVTEDIGTLYLIGSVNKEAVEADCVKHLGLSIFFRPNGDIYAKYIKSFVFTDVEAKLVRRGRMTTIRDIGYFLDLSNVTMDIICLESGMDKRVNNDSMFGTQKVTRVVFNLEYDETGYMKLSDEASKNRNMAGFRLAVSKAFRDMVNITDDSIVPTIFPGEGNVVTFDYIKE